jgi:hypothetical protein
MSLRTLLELSVRAAKIGVKVKTDYWRKPVPTNAYDWEAYEADDGGENYRGFGATEAEAIEDLLEQLETWRAEA